MPPEDYWPNDITNVTVVTPVSFLREQASFLGAKTNQQLTAEVRALPAIPGASFVWSFQLWSPALKNYRYELFRVTHEITLYPATVTWENNPTRVVRDETQLKDQLRTIIGSEQTRKIVQALLAQVGCEDGDERER